MYVCGSDGVGLIWVLCYEDMVALDGPSRRDMSSHNRMPSQSEFSGAPCQQDGCGDEARALSTSSNI
eukprot:1159052-Pelagomonas_calceolata.AAC.5